MIVLVGRWWLTCFGEQLNLVIGREWMVEELDLMINCEVQGPLAGRPGATSMYREKTRAL